eukprot:TRINITY_DN1744_c0_g1_i8.p1 TRINITY_DN1744_c0_g1~~TRINITY_DN1744_c0_g1_i8.p1  ORF type:complete len:1749 (+),score=244.11 TRINITY_DN1744_c0_g1_i8:3140-8386(+)
MHQRPGQGRHALECGWAALNWILDYHGKKPISFDTMQDYQQKSANQELAMTGRISEEEVNEDGYFSFGAINEAYKFEMKGYAHLETLTDYSWSEPEVLLIGTGAHWYMARKLKQATGYEVYDTDRPSVRYESLSDLWHNEISGGNSAFAPTSAAYNTQEVKTPLRGGGTKNHHQRYSIRGGGKNPGLSGRIGKLTVGTINITTLEGKEDVLTDLGLDVIALQETQVDAVQQKRMKRTLEAKGWEVIFGEPCKRMTDGAKTRLTTGGVAILVKKGTPVRRIHHQQLDETCRFVHAGIAYGKGKVLHVFSFYGIVGNAERTEILIQEMLTEAAALGNVPVLIAGDFNLDTTDSPALQTAAAQGRWLDIGVMLNVTEATCNSGKGLRRIDAILTNHVAATAIDGQTKFSVSENPLIKTHKVVKLERLCLERYNEKTPRLIVPVQFECQNTAVGPDEASRVQWRAERWNAAKETQSTDKMLETLGEITEEFFLRKLDISEGERRKFVGRGKKRTPRMRTNAPRQDRRGATSKETLKRLKRIHTLEKVLKLARQHDGPMTMTHEITRLWDDLRKLDESAKRSTPTIEEIVELLNEARREHAIAARETRQRRLTKWKRDAVDNWNDYPAKVFAQVRDAQYNRTVLMQKANEEWTANCMEIDREMQSAWEPILRKYKEKPEPDWDRFWKRYQKYIQKHPMTCEDITTKDVAEALGRTSNRKAAGIDGFRVSELKALPKDVLPMIAELFNVIEDKGWPEALLTALVSTIPKGAGTKPLEQRPITVTSALYRLWGSIRMRKDVMDWQEKWAHDGQYGYRKSRSAMDLSWKLALDVELAALTGGEIAGATTDFKKCFDLIPHDILLKLVKEMGLSERILKPTTDVYNRLNRRFKYPNGVGEPFETTNGILQGCPLSVVYFNALSSVLNRAIEEEAKINPGSYADDLTLFGPRDKLQDGVNTVTEFCELTGQELAPQKCKWFSNREKSDDNITMMGTTLKFDDSVDIVGCHISMHGTTEQEGRVNQEIEDRAKRIQVLPLRHKAKEQIAAASVMPKALYGIAVYDPKPEKVKSLRKMMANAIFKKIGKRTKMSHTMGLTLLSKGHCVDPEAYITYNRLNTLVRMIKKCEAQIHQVWKLLKAGTDLETGTRGPVGLALDTLQKIGWKWTSFEHFSTETETIAVADIKMGSWQHDIREACRKQAWKRVSSSNNRRPNLKGVESGIDREETLKTVNDSGKNAYLRGIVRSGILDNVYSNSMHGGYKYCAFCDEEKGVKTEETLDHINWRCEGYDDIRNEYPQVMEQYRSDWPNCLRLLGIKPNNIVLPEGLTGDLQMMIASIRQKRSNEKEDLLERRLRRVEYAGNKTPEVYTQYNNDLEDYMPEPTAWKEKIGLALYLALAQYMKKLKWSRHPDDTGVTFLELAVDFEAYSGLELPTTIAKMQLEDTTKAAAKKADTIHHLMMKIDQLHKKVNKTTKNTFPQPSTKVKHVKSLVPLGAPTLNGINKRPEFVMGEETVTTTKRLVEEAIINKSDHERFAHNTLIEHAPEQEQRSETWKTAAKKFPSKENDVLLKQQRCDHGPVVAPANVLKKPKIARGEGTNNSTCSSHFKKKCGPCAQDGTVSIYYCCHNHHSANDGLIPIWDYCQKHRMTACAQCLNRSHGAEICCETNHHTCQYHGSPPCESCKAETEPSQRTAVKCCEHKRHHGPFTRTKNRRRGPTKKDIEMSGSLLKHGFTTRPKEKTDKNIGTGSAREPQEKGLT